ncbi:glutathione-dependent disulfide-bond oxidoreductase [Motilimonas pumila]|uniref:Glutathione-dependent disulfide-bond oxidoreductase n=1 Tax=Motilimonas pumila TaxID=2303987 RepID=A0A418YCH2_9GAMM|nr:glutathione-dependent disulfide-bond oxidoreductase [Motilimonas pumila]RJG42197.1 glutathione-dependent disulfide-bond oxidoreductase [Motilimonas pumila]
MMTQYIPPEVWVHDAASGGEWAKINRPVSGATHDKVLPVGNHPLQLYSLATPNGQKVTIMLEELLAAGHVDAEYDAHIINIAEGDQFSSGFVQRNPNSKIPALLDSSVEPGIEVFESASILLYLADKFSAFLPAQPHERVKVMNWLFWLHGSAPYLGGGFGHFYHYAPEKFEYPINRFTMETKRQLDVLDKHLAQHQYLGGAAYSIADIATWPWYGNLMLGNLYQASTFLDVGSYPNLMRWSQQIAARQAVKRGVIVNRTWGEDSAPQLAERHSHSDIDNALNA